MNQKQSRRALIGVGALALLALASPLLLQTWTARKELDGKVLVFEGTTGAHRADLLKCLVGRPEGGLALQISRADEFYQENRRLAVRVAAAPAGSPSGSHLLRAWLPQGETLSVGERRQLQSCLTPPPAGQAG